MGASSAQSCLGLIIASLVVLGAGSVDAVGSCPRVKTNMETWDWSPLSGTTVKVMLKALAMRRLEALPTNGDGNPC